MGTIVLTDPINGTRTDATLIANNNAILKGAINGGLDNNNVSPAAAIHPSKLAGFPNDYSKVLRGDGSWSTLAFPPPTLPIVIGSASYVSGTLTNLLSLPIPAGALGTNRSILSRISGTFFNQSSGDRTYRILVSLGGVPLYDSGAFALATQSANRRAFWLDVEVYNQGAANKQHLIGQFSTSGTGGNQPTVGLGPLNAASTTAPFVSAIAGTTVDTTIAQTLLIQWAWGFTHASLVLTANQVRAILLG